MALRVNLICINFITVLIFYCLVYYTYSFVSKDGVYMFIFIIFLTALDVNI